MMKKLVWCKNCVLPSSRPNLSFDKNGICNACKTKKKNYWSKNLVELKKIIKNTKKKSKIYDCIIPVSGRKR